MIEILTLLLVVFLVFIKTIRYSYCSDDIPAASRPKDPRKLWQILWVFEGRARSKPVYDHILTIAIHAGVCVGIYLAFGSNPVSYVAALLFAVNPAGNQASVWISGRSYALSTFGMVWALALPAIGPVFLLGSTYYNAGFLMPLILIGTKHAWLLFFMPVIWFFHWSRFRRNVVDKMKQEMFKEDREFKPVKIVLALKTFGYYCAHALIPFRTSFYHAFLQSAAGSKKHLAYTMNDRYFAIGVAAAGGILAYLVTQPWGMVSLGLVWWCIGIFPFLNFCRLHQEIAERYMYLPSVGLMLVLATVIQPYPIAVASFFTLYVTKLWFFMDSYVDDYFLVEQSCLNSRDAWFSWHVRAMKRWLAQSYQEAIIMWVIAKNISPKEFKLLFNLATACRFARQEQEAMQFLKLAEENIPAGQEEQANKLINEFRKGNSAVIL